MGKKLQKNKKKKKNVEKNKMKKVEKEGGVGSISCLPDDILWCIIRFVPFEFALQTICVSTRWRRLWNRALLVRRGSENDADRAIDEFLTLFDELDPSIHPPMLQFHFDDESSILSATIVASKKLLHLGSSPGRQPPLPGRHDGLLPLINLAPLTAQPSPSTFFVKILHLTSVSFSTLDISSIVGKFKFLESLNLTKCDGIRYLTIDEYHYLRCLTVLDCPDLYFIWIIHVALQSIRFRGRVCQICSVGDWVFADDAMLHFREGRGDGGVGSLEFYYPNLLVIANVRILTLCKWTFEAVIGPALFSGRKDFRFNELKELLWINSSIEENKFDALFSFLKFCPSLERLFIKIDPALHCQPSTGNPVAQRTRLGRLEVVMLEGLLNQENEILLAERVLEVVNSEPLIIARSRGNCTRSLVKIPSRQLKQQPYGTVAAPQGRKCFYKFVKEVEDISELCSKHAHMGL